MAQEGKKRGRKPGTIIKPKSDELKSIIAAARKLNYDDLKSLKDMAAKILEDRKNARIQEIEQELKELKS